jgi:hypothetical protein
MPRLFGLYEVDNRTVQSISRPKRFADGGRNRPPALFYRNLLRPPRFLCSLTTSTNDRSKFDSAGIQNRSIGRSEFLDNELRINACDGLNGDN